MPDLVTATDTLLLTALCAYLLGSVPFGLIITKMMGLGDLRAIGSGNIGATNVLRTGNKGAALATLLLDGAKGAVAVLLARAIVGADHPSHCNVASPTRIHQRRESAGTCAHTQIKANTSSRWVGSESRRMIGSSHLPQK